MSYRAAHGYYTSAHMSIESYSTMFQITDKLLAIWATNTRQATFNTGALQEAVVYFKDGTYTKDSHLPKGYDLDDIKSFVFETYNDDVTMTITVEVFIDSVAKELPYTGKPN